MDHYSPISKKISYTLLLITLSFALPFSGYTAASAPQGMHQMPGAPMGPGGAQKLSPEDMKMLQEVEQEINKFVTSLPQEEQQKFWTEVDELSKVMGTMNEDELVKFMEGVLQEQDAQQGQQPQPMRPPQPTPAPLPVIEKPAEAPKPLESSEKEQAAFKLVEAILLMLNNFITKAQAIPEFPGKVESWIKEGKVRNITPGTSWNTLRASIEDFMTKLTKMKERDPITGSYRYLAELIKDESAINNLQRLKEVLTRHEPNIDISPFGEERMNKQSRDSARAIINMLVESTTVLGVLIALNKAIEKYEPRAKQIRETEEAAQKLALEGSKKSPYPTPATVAGRSEERAAGTSGRDYSKFDFGLSPYKPAPIPMPAKEKESEKIKGQDKTSGGGAGGGKKGAAGGKGAEGDKSKTPEAKKMEIEDKDSSDAFNAFSKSMFDLAMTLEDKEDDIKGKNKEDKKVAAELDGLSQKVRSATFNLRQLKRHLTKAEKAKPQIKRLFKNAVTDVMKENKDALAILPSAGNAGGPYKDAINEAAEKIADLKKLAETL